MVLNKRSNGDETTVGTVMKPPGSVPNPKFSERSWVCMGGWGVALLVSVLIAPAVWQNWMASEQEQTTVSETRHMISPSMVTFALPTRPTHWPDEADAVQPALVGDAIQMARAAEKAVPSDATTRPATTPGVADPASETLSPVDASTPETVTEGSPPITQPEREAVAAAPTSTQPPTTEAPAPTKPPVVAAATEKTSPAEKPAAAAVAKAAAAASTTQAVATHATPAAPPVSGTNGQKEAAKPAQQAVAAPPQQPQQETASRASLVGQYTIQVGSFSDRNGAVKLAKTLKTKGFEVWIKESKDRRDPNRCWNSVHIGAFPDTQTAKTQLAAYVHRAGKGDGAYVTRIKPFVPCHPDATEDGTQPAAFDRPVTAPAQPIQTPASHAREPALHGTTTTPQRAPAAASTAPQKGPAVAHDDQNLANRLYQQSLTFRKSKEPEKEEPLLRRVLERDPTHRKARNRLVRLLVGTNRIPDGLALLKGAVRGRSTAVMVAEDPNLAAFLAALYQQQGQHGKSVELYRSLLQRFPSKGIWRMGMAISAEKMGQHDKAFRAYKEALVSGDLSDKLRLFVQQSIARLQP